MERSTWEWGSACQGPCLTKAQMPPERLEFGPSSTKGMNYYAAYRRGRQVDGSYYPSAWSMDSGPGLEQIHLLQWVKGYGPLYWHYGPDEYYKVNLFLCEVNEEKLSQRIGMEIIEFDPTAV